MIDDIYFDLKEIWNYMNLNQVIKKCDLIVGCGCTNRDIPKLCSRLYKEGFAKEIAFTGGYGKVTKNINSKTEAEIFRDIAIEQGVSPNDIYLDTKSRNTKENFINLQEIIKNNDLNVNSILIVHNAMYERRTYNTAKKILKDKEIMITSNKTTFDDYFINLKNKSYDEIHTIIAIHTSNIQRMIIYPCLGFQIEDEVPEKLINVYYHLKSLGYDDFIIKKDELEKLYKQYGTASKEFIYFE